MKATAIDLILSAQWASTSLCFGKKNTEIGMENQGLLIQVNGMELFMNEKLE